MTKSVQERKLTAAEQAIRWTMLFVALACLGASIALWVGEFAPLGSDSSATTTTKISAPPKSVPTRSRRETTTVVTSSRHAPRVPSSTRSETLSATLISVAIILGLCAAFFERIGEIGFAGASIKLGKKDYAEVAGDVAAVTRDPLTGFAVFLEAIELLERSRRRSPDAPAAEAVAEAIRRVVPGYGDLYEIDIRDGEITVGLDHADEDGLRVTTQRQFLPPDLFETRARLIVQSASAATGRRLFAVDERVQEAIAAVAFEIPARNGPLVATAFALRTDLPAESSSYAVVLCEYLHGLAQRLKRPQTLYFRADPSDPDAVRQLSALGFFAASDAPRQLPEGDYWVKEPGAPSPSAALPEQRDQPRPP